MVLVPKVLIVWHGKGSTCKVGPAQAWLQVGSKGDALGLLPSSKAVLQPVSMV